MEMKSRQLKKITLNFLLLMSVRWFFFFLAWQEIPDGPYNDYNLIQKTEFKATHFSKSEGSGLSHTV